MIFEQYNVKVKVCLIGDTYVGKTCLVRRYVMDIFNDKYISTLGMKVSKKQVSINKGDKKINLSLSIWDILGQENFKNIHSKAFNGAKGAILVCDLTRKDTLNNILTWKSRLKEVVGEIPLIIIANKSDLTADYEFSEDDLRSFSSELNAPCYMTSAKFGDNVIKTFYKIGELITNEMFND